MSCFHCPTDSNSSKIVSVSCQTDGGRNTRNTHLKSREKKVAIVHVVIDSNTGKFFTVKRNCVLNCQDKEQSWRESALSSPPTDNSELRKAYSDFPYSSTQSFLLRSAYTDFLSSATKDSLLPRTFPNSPPSPTRESLLTKSCGDNPSRLSSVIEESESFDKREALTTAPSIADPIYYNAPRTLSRNFVDEKPEFKQGKTSTKAPKTATEGRPLSSLLLYPLMKIRDAYMKCMTSIEEAGDFTGMIQGGHIASTGPHFGDLPLSRTDMLNYG